MSELTQSFLKQGNIVANAGTVVFDATYFNSLVLHCAGTFAGVNCTFEATVDGTNWFGVLGARTNTGAVEGNTGVLAAAPAYAWQFDLIGMSGFRVRATAYTSGTQVWSFIGSTASYDTSVAISGTTTTATQVQGAAARNTSAPGNPLYVATGVSANPTAVTAGRNVDLQADLQGRAVVQLGNVPQLQDFATVTAVLTTTETTLLAAVASVRHSMHSIVVANRDNVAHTVRFRDTTGGTVRLSVVVPAGQTVPVVLPQGLAAAAVNTNWTYQLAEVSTTAVEISYQSYRLGY